MISKILVATDGSEPALKSIHFSISLAKQIGANLVLLSVVDKGFFLPTTIPETATQTHIKEPAEDFLRRAVEIHLKDMKSLCEKNEVSSKTVVRSGDPVEEIIQEAEESSVDLVVVGSHGKSALKDVFLGSVTDALLHKESNVPVVVVKR